MEILSYIFSLTGLFCMIAASLVKGERIKITLFYVFMANALVATSYLIGGKGINAAATCYLGALQTLINYFFDSKNKPLPKWLIAIYALSFIALNIWVAGGITLVGIFVIVTTMTFIGSILQKNGRKYRIWTSVNIGLWCTHDIIVGTYNVLIVHGIQLATTIIGMIIHDRKKNIA